jgi:sugar (pentulose or hexulose) kinase
MGAGVPRRAIIVIDVGKTMAKATLWSADGALIDRQSRANAVLGGVLDADGIEDWLATTLSGFAKRAEVGAIIPVAHGAAAALIHDGRLVCRPRDYEAPVPSDIRAAYDDLRGPFEETGSPALPNGLNLGVQLFAQLDCRAPPAMTTETILLWPQYWSWLLSGVASSEVTSLGCHSDLWSPTAGDFSSLAKTMGWADRFPLLRRAGDVLGPITAEWADRTGLPRDAQIHCGVHDSNAALVAARGFAEIAGQEATLLSTGTWFIAMRSGGGDADLAALPEARDGLVNVDVEGRPVPSARFMGGREIEVLGARIDQPGLAGLFEVIANRIMILPNFAPGCGPFPDVQGRWINEPTDPDQRRAAIGLYAALVADTALDLIGSRDTLLIEGRFSQSEVFARALATLRPDTFVYQSTAEGDVSFGALRLVDPSIKPAGKLVRVASLAQNLSTYKAEWHQRIEGNAA